MIYTGKEAYENAPAAVRAMIGEPDWERFMLFTFDDVAAMWFSKWFDGAEVGVWVAEGHRHSPTLGRHLTSLLSMTLEKLPVVVAYTQQQRVGCLLEHLGFAFVGIIPAAQNGNVVQMYQTTRGRYRGLKHGTK